MSRRTSSLGEALAEVISEQVEGIINDMDLSDKISDEMPNIEDMVETAVKDIDIDNKISDAIDDYDFSDHVQKEVEAELQANLTEYVEDVVKGDKFKAMVEAEVNSVLDARDAAIKAAWDAKCAKVIDYIKFGPLRRRWMK